MAKISAKETTEVSLYSEISGAKKPRLHKLIIRNFRCIGNTPVEIELDDIVVLVGANNSGKSTILRAFEIAMSQGSVAGKLTLDDFTNSIVDVAQLPEIELQTIIFDKTPGERWIKSEANGDLLIRERWIWENIGESRRQGFDVQKNDWDPQVPWGAPNVANSRRPQPHRVEAFADPVSQAEEIVELLLTILKDRVKTAQSGAELVGEKPSKYFDLIERIRKFQKDIVEESKAEIEKVESEISAIVSQVFQDYSVTFDAKPEDNIEKSLNFFKADAKLLMGPINGYKSDIERQGSGARRTLLWAALKIISESTARPKKSTDQRPHVLLLDEPELCLHPNAIRDSCKVLYDLANNENWQVMVTTHSPAFVDFTRDNTTIVKVEKKNGQDVQGTTIFRPAKAQLSEDDKRRLKMLNLCDPYLAEFFFGGHSIIVEGDTEYTALKYVADVSPSMFPDLHIIRARGKATIPSLAKILNHFGAKYAVLHDSDVPVITTRRTQRKIKNPAWSTNEEIRKVVLDERPPETKARLVASKKNFEYAYLGDDISEGEKPYNALIKLKENFDIHCEMFKLLRSLTNFEEPVPTGATEWNSLEDLEKSLSESGVTWEAP
jgi:putative ATP-dependent endonuclease of OLD family